MPTDCQAIAEPQELFRPEDWPEGFELTLPLEQQRKRFTAEHVAHNQARYLAIVRALGQNMPMRWICQAFAVSHHTVKTIRERDPELVATEKQRFSRMLGHTARLCIESFLEDLENGKVPPNVKSVAAAIFLDKKALIDGEATSRVEHVRSGPSVEEVRAELAALEVPAAVQLLDSPPVSEFNSEGNPPKTPRKHRKGTA